jgi:hypothetical protein
MTITTEEPPVAELQLRDGDYRVQPEHCYGCGHTPCMWRPYGYGDVSSCLYGARPETLQRAAELIAARVLNRDFGLPDRTADWMPGTGDMLRALAGDLLEWAERADRAARRRVEGGR